MAAVTFGHKLLFDDRETGFRQPPAVCLRVSVRPRHRRRPTEPPRFRARPRSLSGRGEKPAAGAEPVSASRDQTRLSVERHMDEGVQADDRIETRWSE
jgi:hypothetical protein